MVLVWLSNLNSLFDGDDGGEDADADDDDDGDESVKTSSG